MCRPDIQEFPVPREDVSMTSDVLIFRDFEDRDLARVKTIFADGMISLAPVLANILIRNRILTLNSMHPLVLAVIPLVVSVIGKWLDRSCFWTGLSIYVGSAVLISIGHYLIHHFVARGRFKGYINKSLADDLANIPSVYQSNGGVFLVACTKDNNQVVGMVAGEFKESTEQGRVYELRRMSVDSAVRGLGIGRKLVNVLESRLQDPSKIILYTSNLQFAAHRMYEKLGYKKEGATTYENWPLAFEIWYYVKDLAK